MLGYTPAQENVLKRVKINFGGYFVADDVDDCVEQQERMAGVLEKYRLPVVIPKGNGCCQECGIPIEGDGRWCGAECRDDAERAGHGKKR